MAGPARPFLVITHTGRAESIRAAREAIQLLAEAGTMPVLPAQDVADVGGDDEATRAVVRVLGVDVALDEIELAIVLGGDGTILRAAELVRPADIPIIGVNLGHVGFLAEAEREDLAGVVRRAIAVEYDVEERMTLEIVVLDADDREVHRDWALNE
ncbi:MAG: NAD(+)/NADH kinase, partial [Microbacteriaceae bacterium]|nr:NAD(+)/NADH kinase [Microbacteriaceae bacterium]